jgi:hypothetical protein
MYLNLLNIPDASCFWLVRKARHYRASQQNVFKYVEVFLRFNRRIQFSHLSTWQGVIEEAQRAVFKYGKRAPQITTQLSSKNKNLPISFADRQIFSVARFE